MSNEKGQAGNSAICCIDELQNCMPDPFHNVQKLLQASESNAWWFFGFFATKPINYADKDGNTALILAIKSVCYSYINNQEYNICLNSQSIIQELLEIPGIDLHHVNKKGETALTLLEKLNNDMSRYPY